MALSFFADSGIDPHLFAPETRKRIMDGVQALNSLPDEWRKEICLDAALPGYA